MELEIFFLRNYVFDILIHLEKFRVLKALNNKHLQKVLEFILAFGERLC